MFSILETRISDGEYISFDVENKLSRTSECCLIPITNKELILGHVDCADSNSVKVFFHFTQNILLFYSKRNQM